MKIYCGEDFFNMLTNLFKLILQIDRQGRFNLRAVFDEMERSEKIF